MAHSWETCGREWEHRCDDDDDVNVAIDPDAATKDEAEIYLYEYIVELKLSGMLSATQACQLCFWAAKAGVNGGCSKLGRRPGLSGTGRYSAHFDNVVGKPVDDDYLHIAVPQYRRSCDTRVTVPMPVTPPFEHLVSEWRLRHALLRDALPGFATTPHYASHPVVNTAPEGVFVWPISVYLDGVKFARQDSVLGIWIACHLTGKRFLCANMRKSELCTCGCRGWCSLWPVFSMMDWAHDALAEGRYPSDAPPTVTFDEGRRTMANVPFGFRAAVLFIRGDWSEYTSSLGLPNWKTIHNPCPMCCCERENMYEHRGVSALELPWPQTTHRMYMANCDRAEHVVVSTAALWRRIRATLAYNVSGSIGRALGNDIPEAGLLRGDRLAPSAECPDVGYGFDAVMPTQVTFWRPLPGASTFHRNPLFNERRGTGIDRVLVQDFLHVLSLGAFETFNAACTWQLLNANIFDVHESSAHAVLVTNTLRLRADICAFYAREARAGVKHCQIQDLTPGMLGSRDNPKMALHAAEQNGYSFYLRHLLALHTHIPNHDKWSHAQRAMETVITLYRKHPITFPPADCQRFADAMREFVKLNLQLNVTVRPKLHACLHMARDVIYKGSPQLWATWRDEGLNNVLKKIAAGIQRVGWHARVLHNANDLLDRIAYPRGYKRRIHESIKPP